MSKHTTGPWKVCETENGWSVRHADDTEILDGCVVTHTHKKIIGDVCGFNWKGTEHEANARLIAAAPELLEIAKLILKEWEAPTEGVQKGELITRLSQYSIEARAVIEKAEGRSDGEL